MNRALIISTAAHLAMLVLLWQLGVAFSRPVTHGYPRLMTATLVTKTIMALAAGSAGPPAAAEPKVAAQPEAPKFTPAKKEKEVTTVTSKAETKKPPATAKSTKAKSSNPAAKVSSPNLSGSRGGAASSSKTGTGGGGNSIEIEAAAFPYAYYSDAIQNRIESNWQAPEGPEPLIAVVYFKIARNGEIKAIKLEKASGSFEFDRAAISAVTYASPLPPLPVDYRETMLVIRYEFVANNF